MTEKLDVNINFGKKVREIRNSKNMTQEVLAHLCELDRSYIGSVERGERNISLVNIKKIADALGVEIFILFK